VDAWDVRRSQGPHNFKNLSNRSEFLRPRPNLNGLWFDLRVVGGKSDDIARKSDAPVDDARAAED
jgi:hypothetical protein